MSFINEFSKYNIGRPQQPLTEKGAKIQRDILIHDSTKNFFFQNTKLKPNSRVWITLKSSVGIFQALETLQT